MKIKLAQNEGLSVVLSAGGQFVLPDVHQGQVFVPGSSTAIDAALDTANEAKDAAAFAVENSTLSAYYKGNSDPAKMTWRFECPSPLQPSEVVRKLYYDAESPQHDDQIMWEVLTHEENAYYPKSGQNYIYTTSADTSCTFDVYNFNTGNEYTISAYRTDVTIVGYKLGSQDPVLANTDSYVFSALTVNGKALSSDIVINASDVSAATETDVFLEPQFSNWTIDPPSYNSIPYEIRLMSQGVGHGYWQLYWNNNLRAIDNMSKYDSTTVSFTDPTTGSEVSAVRKFAGGYVLGSQTDKPLATAEQGIKAETAFQLSSIVYGNSSYHDYLTARNDNGNPVDPEISAFIQTANADNPHQWTMPADGILYITVTTYSVHTTVPTFRIGINGIDDAHTVVRIKGVIGCNTIPLILKKNDIVNITIYGELDNIQFSAFYIQPKAS